ncbi:MAG: recombinase family protein [Oscillospiraceae bacterium]|nr:recombinase family protein [Oscillospiraceae bacterium]
MMNAAIYIRLSEEDRDKVSKGDDSESITNQRNMLVDYATERGWDIFDIYSDEDYSGSDGTRPAFNRMLADARQRKFGVVLCKSLSRFARDVAMVEKYINGLFIEWQIRFISLTDYADSSQKGSRKNIQINSLVNQWYLEDLSENIRATMTGKKKQGQYTGAFAPYGYLKDPQDKHKLIIDPEAAAVVQRIYKLYLDGYGNKAIANCLNDEGVPCPSKYRQINGIKSNRSDEAADVLLWSDHTVWHILRNPNYTGTLVQNRYGKATYKSKTSKERTPDDWIVVENTHELIVSKEDYERVQTAKATRGLHNRNASTSRAVSNIFAGIIKCKVCGRSLITSGSGRLNKSTKYLRCAGRKSGIAKCTCAMVKYDVLVDELTERIRNIITLYCDPEQLAKHAHSRDFSGEIAALQRAKDKIVFELKRVSDALSSSYIDKTSGALSENDFALISANLRDKREKLEADDKHIQAQLDKLHEKQNAGDRVANIIAQYQDFLELDRDIVRAFIEVIRVGERDGETNEFGLEIVYNF